jgi:hypothetical protein
MGGRSGLSHKLRSESGREDLPFFELAISNMYTLNVPSWNQTSKPMSYDKIISQVAIGRSEVSTQ